MPRILIVCVPPPLSRDGIYALCCLSSQSPGADSGTTGTLHEIPLLPKAGRSWGKIEYFPALFHWKQRDSGILRLLLSLGPESSVSL